MLINNVIFLSDPLVQKREAIRGEILRQLLHKGIMKVSDLKTTSAYADDYADFEVALQFLNNEADIVFSSDGLSINSKVSLTGQGFSTAVNLLSS